jgi:hypothetical protein
MVAILVAFYSIVLTSRLIERYAKRCEPRCAVAVAARRNGRAYFWKNKDSRAMLSVRALPSNLTPGSCYFPGMRRLLISFVFVLAHCRSPPAAEMGATGMPAMNPPEMATTSAPAQTEPPRTAASAAPKAPSGQLRVVAEAGVTATEKPCAIELFPEDCTEAVVGKRVKIPVGTVVDDLSASEVVWQGMGAAMATARKIRYNGQVLWAMDEAYIIPESAAAGTQQLIYLEPMK